MPLELLAAIEATTQSSGITNLYSVEAIVAFLTLCALEIVLGIDNVIFISILSNRLPDHQARKARQLGLLLAMAFRIMLLFLIGLIMSLTEPFIKIDQFWTSTAADKYELSWRDLILIGGGLFLMVKAILEIHHKLEGDDQHASVRKTAGFWGTIAQILLLDIVFSLDSVITAVGMVQTDPAHRSVGMTIMIAAIVVAVMVMLISAGSISAFVERHPTMKMLALAFLMMIGFVLVIDGLGQHVPKGYIYFAMAFSLMVELLNMKLRKKGTPVRLHGPAQ